MNVYTKTHQGLVRANNQDSVLATSNAYGIADGMGGHKGGETASRITVQIVKNALQGKIPEEHALKTAVEAANRRVFDMGSREEELSGMGTTLTLLWESSDEILIAHVGDSRAYLFRDGKLSQETEDHSMVAELIKNKVITQEDVKEHPYRNVITRAVGIDPMVMPDILIQKKQPGDIWLICSDGLHNMVSDNEMVEVLTHLKGEAAAEKLLELAIEHGGTDNISFVLGEVAEVSRE